MIRLECMQCCTAFSGPDEFRLYDKADRHERDNPGHHMTDTEEYDD